MASISRQAALRLIRPSTIPLRSFASVPPTTPVAPTTTPASSSKAKKQDATPKYSPPAVFPSPHNPFEEHKEPAPEERPKYSETQRKLVRGIARMMGYNSRASTAIRETSRMMKGIVEAIERDREFWYEECRLPPTYQTFFQLHLLYVLTMLPRLRALPASQPTHQHPIPEPAESTPPQHTPDVPPTPTSDNTTVGNLLTRPNYESYPSELINHFFEMSETQMRRVLGRGERERVVKNYMAEMGEQWRGAGVGLDYAMGLQISEDSVERERADAELASWVWRNLFGARGLGAPAPGLIDPSMADEFGLKEVEMAEQLGQVVRFIRKEQVRLDGVSQRDVLDGNVGYWGSVQEA